MMRIPVSTRSILVVLMTAALSTAIMAGCGTEPRENGQAAGNAGVSSVKKADGIQVTLRSEPKVAKPGGEFSLTLNVRNLSGESRTFTLPSTQNYEFISTAKGGGQAWRWSNGMMFAQVVTPMKMAAGDSSVFKAAWDPAGLSTGKYTIQGYFLGMDQLRPTVTVEIAR